MIIDLNTTKFVLLDPESVQTETVRVGSMAGGDEDDIVTGCHRVGSFGGFRGQVDFCHRHRVLTS